MQGRVGPPLLQPYYDVRKLIEKDDVSVNTVEGTYITFALVLTVVGGGVFVAGGNFLMCLPHHAFGAVLHRGCVFLALPVFRGWRRPRNAAGHGV